MDWRVLAVSAAAALVTGGVFGLAPALIGTRVDLSSAMKSGGAGSVSGGGARLRSLLIVGEVAVALVLLVGSLLFVTSFLKVTSIPLGVEYDNVVVSYLNGPSLSRAAVTPEERWAESARFHGLAERVVERVRAVPGVEDVAAASGFPFSAGTSSFSYELPGRPGFKWSRDQHRMVAMKMVSPNYLQLLRVPLIRGRYLDDGDRAEAEGAVVLSESAARMIWPGEDPIGQEIDLQKRLRVVGIVADVRMGGPEVEPYPDVYVPLRQGRGTYASSLVIRTALPADQMLPSLRAAIQEVDPSQRVRDAITLEGRLARLLAQRRFNMLVVGSFGALAVLIAAIGIYGVMAYLVMQRTREIGVRMALGASRASVLRLVLRRAAALTALGLAAGGAGVWYFNATVRAFLFELDPLDLRVIAAAALLMAVTAFVASAIPARRAASVDPLIALRQD
jgi:predicted permease